MVENDKVKDKIICHRCSYIWLTSSQRYSVLCPNCNTSVRNPNVTIESLKSLAKIKNKRFEGDNNGKI